MKKKIILGFILFFSLVLNTFADFDYYIGNNHYYLKNVNGCSLYDSNNNLLDNISNTYSGNCYGLFYDSGVKKYYVIIHTNQEYISPDYYNYYDYYYIENNQFVFHTSYTHTGSWHNFHYLFNGNWADWTDSYLSGLGYAPINTFGQGNSLRNVGSKRMYFSGQNVYISNDTGGANSINFGKDPNYGEIQGFNIDNNNFAVLDKNTDGTYKYYIFSDNLGTLQYTSNNITLTGGPSSCNDFSYDQMIYDECNMFGFTEFCNMDMYQVCGSKADIKYNTINKIIVETPYDSFSEENTYLASINSSPNQNIDGYFTDQYVWNSDLQCRVFYKTDGIIPSCSGKLIQDGNSLYCNPNLTHFGVTYSSPYFPYYLNETDIDYSCGAIYDNSGIQGPPGPAGPQGPAGTDGIDGTNGTNGVDGINGIDGQDGTNGTDGFNCWDINLNHINDLSEDKNGDGFFNTLDCYGTSGIDGQNGLDGKDGLDGQDGINGTDGVNGIDGKDGLNGETIETLSDDTKGFWDGIFDKIGGLFSIDPNKVTDLQNSLSGALDTGTSGFSVGTGGTSGINYTPGNSDYGNIINRNDNNKTCDMFNSDGSFAYYSNGSYDLSIDLNGLLDLGYADKVPFLEELLFIPNKILSFVTNPLNNIFSTLRVFGGIGENTYCYFGTLQTIQFQKHIMVGASFFGGEIIFIPGTLTIIDYLILFFMGLPMLILTVRILLY